MRTVGSYDPMALEEAEGNLNPWKWGKKFRKERGPKIKKKHLILNFSKLYLTRFIN